MALGLTLASCETPSNNPGDDEDETAFTVRFDLNGGNGTASVSAQNAMYSHADPVYPYSTLVFFHFPVILNCYGFWKKKRRERVIDTGLYCPFRLFFTAGVGSVALVNGSSAYSIGNNAAGVYPFQYQ